MPSRRPRAYFGSVGGVVGVVAGAPGWFDMVGSPVCGAASVGGVVGMLGGAALGEGFTDMSVEELVDELVVAESLDAAGAVAEVS
ncbi:MAG TPA: hypothetical protein VN113_08135, partial [Caulobacter sp.]|nr:hypothetical protein [Caulobacter sp.]